MNESSQGSILFVKNFFNSAKLFFNPSPFIIFISILFLIPSSILLAQDFWETTGGPEGGEIFSIASNESGEIFCTAYGRIYSSEDNGAHWKPLYVGLPEDYINTILCISTKIILAGTDNNGLYRSTDNGNSWTKLILGTETRINNFLKKSSGEIFTAAYGGIYKSTDMGVTWIKKASVYGIRCFTIDLDGRIIAGAVGEVYISTNNGEQWTAKFITPGNIPVRGLVVNSSNHIFAGVWGNEGFYRSTNHGETWTPFSNGFIHKYISTVIITGMGTMYAGNAAGIYRSADNGANWVKLNNLTDAYVCTLLSKDEILFAGARYGVGAYSSTDGGETWVCINNNIFNLYITGLVTANNGDIFASSWVGGVFRYRNGEWESANNGLTYLWVKDVTVCLNEYIFAGTGYGGGIFRTTNYGEQWTRVNNGIPTNGHVEVVEFDYVHNQVLAGGTTGRILRSTNYGEQWELKILGDKDVKAFTVTLSGEIIIGTIGGGLYKSTDNLNTFIPINNGILAPYDIRDLAVNSNNEIFAASVHHGIYKSTNKGDEWFQINNGLSSPHVLSLQFDFKGGLYAGVFGGVFFSNDNGETWLTTSGLTDTYVRDLCIGNDSTVYAGTVFGGVCRNSDTTATMAEEPAAALGFILQNYPNPFNPSTSIKYSIPTGSKVIIKIFDILGKEIETLVNEEMQPGTYELSWNTADLSSGIYFCRMQVGGFIKTRKMVLVR